MPSLQTRSQTSSLLPSKERREVLFLPLSSFNTHPTQTSCCSLLFFSPFFENIGNNDDGGEKENINDETWAPRRKFLTSLFLSNHLLFLATLFIQCTSLDVCATMMCCLKKKAKKGHCFLKSAKRLLGTLGLEGAVVATGPDGEGGGVLLNQCRHQLDLLQWLCGMPVKVRAFCHEGKWHDIEVEDDVTAYMEFENGATGVFVTTTADAPGTNRLELTFEMGKIVCEEGRLFFDKLSTNVSDFCKTEKEGFKKPEYSRIEIETDGQNEQHIGALKAFAGHILRGTPLVAEGTEGIRGLTLSNAMHLSSWLDRTVELPLDEELFLRELNKKRATSRKKEDTDIVFDTTGTY